MADPDPDTGNPDTGNPVSDLGAGEAVEHLRSAAREMIGAMRGFLDIAEQLVDDPKAGDAVLSTVTDLADAARRGARSAVDDVADRTPYEPIDLDLDD